MDVLKVMKRVTNRSYFGSVVMNQHKFVRTISTDNSPSELKMPRFVSKNWAKHQQSLINVHPTADACIDRHDMRVNTYPIAKSKILGNVPSESTLVSSENFQALCSSEELFSRFLNYPCHNLKSKGFPLFHDARSDEQLKIMACHVLQMSAGNFPSDACVPTVSSILQTTSKDYEWQCWKLKIIRHYGIEAFSKHVEEIYDVEYKLRERICKFLTHKLDYVSDQQTDGYWHSIQTFLRLVSDVISVECKIRHPFLHYTGVIDCIGTFSNQQVLIEWCTPHKFLPILRNGCDRPLQTIAYLGALNAQREEPNHVSKILLVVAYPNGGEASVFEISSDFSEKLWMLWLARLADYWDLRKSCPDAFCSNLLPK